MILRLLLFGLWQASAARVKPSLEHSWVREGDLEVKLAPEDPLRTCLVVLSAKSVDIWYVKKLCEDSEHQSQEVGDECLVPELALQLDVSTVSVQAKSSAATFSGRWLSPDVAAKAGSCMVLHGCRDAECKRGLQELLACSTDDEEIQAWSRQIDEVYLERNHIQDRLGFQVSVAIMDVSNSALQGTKPKLDPGSELPVAFSPILCWAESTIQRLYDQPGEEQDARLRRLLPMATEFGLGVVPHSPGKNSRSGATFFFSRNRKYIAKRIRAKEYKSLWHMSETCDYSHHVLDETLVNKILLAFLSPDRLHFWIAMETEALSEEIQELLPPSGGGWTRGLSADLKPSPMISDRLEFGATLLEERARTGLRMKDWEGFGHIREMLKKDLAWLGSQKLIDYSLLVYGRIFHSDPDDPESQRFFTNTTLQEKLANAVAAQPGCAFGCSYRAKQLVDVTEFLDPNTMRIRHGQQEYKCCCTDLSNGASASAISPCALVDVKSGTGVLNFIGSKDSCSRLLSKAFRSSWQADLLPQTQGRCIVAREVFRHDGSAFRRFRVDGERKPVFLAPEAFDTRETPAPQYVEACGLICASMVDYLLPFDTANKLENLALLPHYGVLKWSSYETRMRELLACLGEAATARPDTNQRTRPLFQEANGAEQQALVQLGVEDDGSPKPIPPDHCENVLPPVRRDLDAEVVKLLTLNWTAAGEVKGARSKWR